VGQALAACNYEDTVIVCPGRHHEEVNLDRAVRLESWAGPAQTYLRGAHVTANGVRFAGFWLSSLEVEATVDAQLLGLYVLGADVYLPLVVRDWQQ
jgi:hypothetical protein